MKIYLFITILFIHFFDSSTAQFNCKTIKDSADKIITYCYHSNKKISTVEMWDINKHNGLITGFNATGKEIFKYYLRRFSGHASVHKIYYPNGQIKKIEYSSAPDGGIQFWHIIQKFDENGNQIEYLDLSQPDGRPTTILKQFDTTENLEKFYLTKQKNSKKNKDTIVGCAPIFCTKFEIVNETKFKFSVLLKAQNNFLINLKDTMIHFLPKQTLNSQNIYLSSGYLLPNQSFILDIKAKNRIKRKLKIIEGNSKEFNQQRTYTYYVIKT